MFADFVVLDRDVTAVGTQKLLDTTWCEPSSRKNRL